MERQMIRTWIDICRRRRRLVVVLAAAALVAVSLLPLLMRSATASHGAVGDHPARELALARRASARFHNVEAALAAGYGAITIKGDLCVTHHHLGAMGIHYLNPALVDGTLDPSAPELLLYEPTEQGLRLIAVEYFTPDSGQAHPRLFARLMDGPNSTLEPEIPRHYSLHVWAWKHNPAGMFAPYNPSVSCPG
jgi:hypothetical protein